MGFPDFSFFPRQQLRKERFSIRVGSNLCVLKDSLDGLGSSSVYQRDILTSGILEKASFTLNKSLPESEHFPEILSSPNVEVALNL